MSGAQYLVRFDDACPTMRQDTWRRVAGILEERRVRPLLAVVPDNRDPELAVDPPNPDFWQEMVRRRDAGWTIALHGYQHLKRTRNGGLMGINHAGEFAGLSCGEQREMLDKASAIFRGHGLETDAWVSPFHSHDGNTLRLLREAGVQVVSDGFHFLPYTRECLFFVPQQLWDFRPLPCGVWTVCFHPNNMTGDELDRFERNIRAYERQIVSVDALRARYGTRRRRPTDWAAEKLLRVYRKVRM
jgi:peptidoglycan/xylan/chitin deacetylase (PgdA/CDA1 family)